MSDRLDGNRPLPFGRDELGRMAYEALVRWASSQRKMAPYESLQDFDKEAYRQMGETVARWTLIGDAAVAALEEMRNS